MRIATKETLYLDEADRQIIANFLSLVQSIYDESNGDGEICELAEIVRDATTELITEAKAD